MMADWVGTLALVLNPHSLVLNIHSGFERAQLCPCLRRRLPSPLGFPPPTFGLHTGFTLLQLHTGEYVY